MENNNLTPNEIFLLGVSYEKQCDYNKAIDYYKKAANNGNIDAISHLGDLYYLGSIIQKDYQEAYKWYTQLFEMVKQIWEETYDEEEIEAYVDSIVNLGGMYERGIGINQNYEEAKKCYELAANYGDKDTLCRLAYLYYNNEEYDKAFKYFEKAGEDWYFSDYMLAEQYFYVDKDYEQALIWYEKALNCEVEEASWKIGEIYYVGLGVKQDYKKAFSYLKYFNEECVDEFEEDDFVGEVPAKINYYLATMYKEGLGVNQNIELANKLFSAAKKGGYKI